MPEGAFWTLKPTDDRFDSKNKGRVGETRTISQSAWWVSDWIEMPIILFTEAKCLTLSHHLNKSQLVVEALWVESRKTGNTLNLANWEIRISAAVCHGFTFHRQENYDPWQRRNDTENVAATA